MKKAYAPETIIDAVINLDVRAKKLSMEQIAIVVDDAYAEFCTITQPFSNEEIVPLNEYYDVGEENITLDVQEDVSAIYEIYLTQEDKDPDIYKHGILKIRDESAIYLDNRYDGRVHVNLLSSSITGQADNAVIKYYYTPTSTTDTVYMDAQTWLALKSALGVALYDMLHDVERNGQKRAELARRVKGIIPKRPEDANDPSYGHIFTGLTH